MQKLIKSRRYLLYPIVLIFNIGILSCFKQKQINIEVLHPFNEIDTVYSETEACIRRVAYFTVDCQLSDSTQLLKQVKQLIENDRKLKAADKYCVSSFWFFKQDEHLNAKYLSNAHDHPEMHIDELLLEVSLHPDTGDAYMFYQKGQVISTNKFQLVPLFE